MRKILLLVATLLAVVILLGTVSPASAQRYTGYIEHPYPHAGTWYCNYYPDGGMYDGYSYWCQDAFGNWFQANPDWYNASLPDLQHAK